MKAGNVKVALKGKKLKGEFALVRLKNDEKGNSWLLIKHRDKFAVDSDYNSEEETLKGSPINKWLTENPDFLKKKAGSKKTTTKKAAPKKKTAKRPSHEKKAK